MNRVSVSSIKVDVLLPVGPGKQPWLGAAIQSLLHQSHENVRVLAILDQRKSIPDSGMQFDSNSRVIFMENFRTPGIAGALNSGLLNATAPLVARLDADDLSHPLRLEYQLALMSDSEIIAAGTESFFFSKSVDWQEIDGRVHEQYRPLATWKILQSNPFAHSSVMFRREPVIALGGYSEDAIRVEDFDLWLRLATMGVMAVLPAPLVARRVHPEQYSRNSRPWRSYSLLRRSRIELARSRWGIPVLGDLSHILYLAEHGHISVRRQIREIISSLRVPQGQ